MAQKHEVGEAECGGKERCGERQADRCDLRMERAFLMGKRAPTTPVPSWKLHEENGSFDDGMIADFPLSTCRETPVSARKLAATLWELQHTPAYSSTCGNASTLPIEGWIADQAFSSAQQNTLPRSPSISNRSPLVEAQRHAVGISKAFLEDFRDGSGVPRLLKHIENLDERNTSSTKLAAALHVELEHAYTQIQELELAYRAVRKEMDNLLKKFADERCVWRKMARDKFTLATQNLKEEIEEQKNSKLQLEITISSLKRQLGEAKVVLSRALQDVERERKTRELLEDVCNELAREIGHDKFMVEELKHASVKVKQEVEEERSMFQMAEKWREERVQMKLAEAKLQLQEKNASLDKLRSELEDFLSNRRGSRDFMNLSHSMGAVVTNDRRNSSYEPWEMHGSGFLVDDLRSVDLNKMGYVHKDDAYGLGYHSDSHQAKNVEMGLRNGYTGMLQEQRVKNKRNRVKDRTRLERSRRSECFVGSCNDGVSSNNDIVWEFANDMNVKKTEDTLPDGLMKEDSLTLTTVHGNTSKRKEKHHFVDLKMKDHQGPLSTKMLSSEVSQVNDLMPLTWEADAKHVHPKSIAWKMSLGASEHASPYNGELNLQLQTLSSEAQCSTSTMDPGSRHAFSKPPRNLKPSEFFNRHIAKGFKGLVEWRKHKRASSTMGDL